jgi:outer membrane protein assembly factor BamC
LKALTRVTILALAAALSACSVLETDKIDYKSARRGAGLDVPPDLTQLSRDNRYAIPGASVSASGFQNLQAGAPVAVAVAAAGDVRIERKEGQRWLSVARPPEALWSPVKDFWVENGFVLTTDQISLGIMETDWAENRAKIPQDFIRATLGKLLDSLYSSAERDRFRTRLERNASGGTDIFITHRGMLEVYADGGRTAGTSGSTLWQPRPADPELETEFLRRLMLRLGGTREQAQAQTAAAAAGPAQATLSTVNNQPVVLLNEDFDRAWRRVGLALDRTGFTVEDRDRAQGTYFVRYVEPTTTKEPGFFSKIFNVFGASSQATPALKLRLTLRSEGNRTTISVQDAAGAPDASANAQRITKVLVDELR